MKTVVGLRLLIGVGVLANVRWGRIRRLGVVALGGGSLGLLCFAGCAGYVASWKIMPRVWRCPVWTVLTPCRTDIR